LTRPGKWRNDAPVRSTRLLALLLIGVITTLAPATYADPPDPTYVAGFWDNDDFDDVVILLEGTAAVVQPLVVYTAPTVDVVATVECPEPLAVSMAVDETASPRAPPLTLSTS
jgi:hypothetical protein